MKTLNNYDNYLLDMLMESVKNDETILVLSDRLVSLLEITTSPIAKKMLELTFNPLPTQTFKITFLDINNKKGTDGKQILDSISFINSNKAIEMSAKELGIELKKGEGLDEFEIKRIHKNINTMDFSKLKGRSETSLGRIVNKLFPNEYDANRDIEPFVNEFKSLRDTSNFELVNGKDIIYWYNEDQYINQKSTLGSSCMKYEKCSDYLTFYSENPDKVSLLILKDKDDETKIRGRAIVWKLDIPKDKIFMDRIYYTDDYLVGLFKDYAIEKGWLYKKNQNMESTEPIIDEKEGMTYEVVTVNGLVDTGQGQYPYMDTLKCFNGEDLSNDGNTLKNTNYMEILTDTDGGTDDTPGDYEDDYEEDEEVYSEYYDEYINPNYYNWCPLSNDYRDDDESYWSIYYRHYIANDYANEELHKCEDIKDETDCYRKIEDCVKLDDGKYYTKEYIANLGLGE